jgi:ribosomal protein L32
MDQASAPEEIDDCPFCGYRPRAGDRHKVLMNEGADDYEFSIVHVVCYRCGMEWVE